MRRDVRPGQPRVVFESEARLPAEAVDAGDDLLARHRGHGCARARIHAHGDGAAGEEDVHVPARGHAASPRRTRARAASTSTPPAMVSREGISPNTV